MVLRDQARKFVGERAAKARARHIRESEESSDAELWRGMPEPAWPGTAIPEVPGDTAFKNVPTGREPEALALSATGQGAGSTST